MRSVFITLANISSVIVIVYFDPTDCEIFTKCLLKIFSI